MKCLQQLEASIFLQRPEASILLCKRRSAVCTGIITPGHQLFQLGIGHIFSGPCIEQEHLIVFSVQAVSFCHFHHRICLGTGVCPGESVAEQPVLAANSKGTDGVFAQVVGETAPAILKIGIQIRSAVERILDCFSKTASFVVSCQFFQPTPEGGQDRRCFLQTICLPLLLRKAVFLAITFNFKELVAVDHALDSCIFRPNCAAQPAKLSIDSVGIEH